jgi:hypothetical protein
VRRGDNCARDGHVGAALTAPGPAPFCICPRATPITGSDPRFGRSAHGAPVYQAVPETSKARFEPRI